MAKMKTDLKNEQLLNKLKDNIDSKLNEKDAFQQFVDLMSNETQGIYSHNSEPWKSRVVVDKIFEAAKGQEQLKMFIGNSKCEFYKADEFFEKIKETACNTLVIIVLATTPDSSMLEKWQLLSRSTNNIEVYYKTTGYDETLYHLCMTEQAYRLEYPHKRSGDSVTITDIYPQRFARFGFFRNDDRRALERYWEDSVFVDCVPIDRVA